MDMVFARSDDIANQYLCQFIGGIFSVSAIPPGTSGMPCKQRTAKLQNQQSCSKVAAKSHFRCSLYFSFLFDIKKI